MRIQQVNITHMDKHGHALFKSDAEVIGISEHKLNKERIRKWKKTSGKAKRQIVNGPSQETGKVPNAGVGLLIKNNLTVVEPPIRT